MRNRSGKKLKLYVADLRRLVSALDFFIRSGDFLNDFDRSAYFSLRCRLISCLNELKRSGAVKYDRDETQ